MGTHPIFESDFDCLTEKHKNDRNWLLETAWTCRRHSRFARVRWRRVARNALRGPFPRWPVGSDRVAGCEEDDGNTIQVCFSEHSMDEGWRRVLVAVNGHIEVHRSQTWRRHHFRRY